jgi:predicted acyl esterase
MQGGWYDFFLRGMLADYAALRSAGRTVRLLIGPWGQGRGLYTRVGMGDALAALDAALADGTPPSGVRVFVTGSRRWIDLPGWPPSAGDTAWYLYPAGRLDRHQASAGRASRFRSDPADVTPSIGDTAVGLSAGPVDNRDRAGGAPRICAGVGAVRRPACLPLRWRTAWPVDQYLGRDRASHRCRSRHTASGRV